MKSREDPRKQTLYRTCDYLSMLGLKLIHIRKSGHWWYALRRLASRSREISKPRDVGLEVSDRSHFSEWCKSNTPTFGCETALNSHRLVNRGPESRNMHLLRTVIQQNQDESQHNLARADMVRERYSLFYVGNGKGVAYFSKRMTRIRILYCHMKRQPVKTTCKELWKYSQRMLFSVT